MATVTEQVNDQANAQQANGQANEPKKESLWERARQASFRRSLQGFSTQQQAELMKHLGRLVDDNDRAAMRIAALESQATANQGTVLAALRQEVAAGRAELAGDLDALRTEVVALRSELVEVRGQLTATADLLHQLLLGLAKQVHDRRRTKLEIEHDDGTVSVIRELPDDGGLPVPRMKF